jgi:hypothetical protein
MLIGVILTVGCGVAVFFITRPFWPKGADSDRADGGLEILFRISRRNKRTSAKSLLRRTANGRGRTEKDR